MCWLKVEQRNTVKLTEILCRRHYRILRAIEHFDSHKSGLISSQQWAEAVEQAVGLRIEWLSLQQQLAPADSEGMVNYRDFLDKFCIEHIGSGGFTGLKPSFSALYDQYPLLQVSVCLSAYLLDCLPACLTDSVSCLPVHPDFRVAQVF